MELELGLKITIADEFTSDFQMKQDHGEDLLFLSRETDSVFILTAHLKGYTRRNIAIDINEHGTLITIRGERQVKGTVHVEPKAAYRKGSDINGFKKVFRIPYEVNLDKIKAKFGKEQSSLTITMPKNVRGIRGSAIEEIQEKQELVKDIGNTHALKDGEKWESTPEKHVDNHEIIKEKVEEVQQNTEPQLDHPSHLAESSGMNKKVDKQDEIEEVKETDEEKEGPFIAEHHEEALQSEHAEQKTQDSWRTCVPVIAGSTFLISLVVLVIQIIRSKHQSSRRKILMITVK